MQVEIKKQVTQIEIINIELPYYYKYDLMSDYGDNIIYGKIEKDFHVAIKENKNYDGKCEYEIEREEHDSIKESGLSCYFDKKYLSNQLEFEKAKNRCFMFLDKF